MRFLAATFTLDRTPTQALRELWGRLWDFQGVWDHGPNNQQAVVLAALLLGVTCGVLGCFIVLRRQSLLGDAIGHSVLPGVCVGFAGATWLKIVTESWPEGSWVRGLVSAGGRSNAALLGGAMASGLLSAWLIGVLQRTTRLKTGECMGVVFTGFYGLGIVLLKWIQNRQMPGMAGLDKFLFGQIAGVSGVDVAYMAVIAALSLGAVVAFWRTLAVSSFDEPFARTLGVPVKLVHYLTTALLTAAIVISIQAVGVVLVAAMLVTPAATAYLLTDRLWKMTVLSALFGAVSGLLGAVFSAVGEQIPTGALMVLGASTLFAGAFLLSPRYGLLPRLWRLRARRRRTEAENLLKSLYLMMERRGPGAASGEVDRRFGVDDVAAVRQESAAVVRRLAREGKSRGWLAGESPDPLILTDDGLAEARRVVRNHRLWELFLTQEAKLASDHVHADAEYIEHVLPRDVMKRLEEMLADPAADPHGKPIPVAGR